MRSKKSDLLAHLVGRLDGQQSRIREAPRLIWGTVTSVAPLRLRLDGDTEPLEGTPQSNVADLAVGQRVKCSLQDNRCTILAATGTVTTNTTDALDERVTETVQAVSEVRTVADDAAAGVLVAAQQAQSALDAAGLAVASTLEQYVVTGSAGVPPGPDAGWDADTPDWGPGDVVWVRTRTTHVSGVVSYSTPRVLPTGADGMPGADAVLLRVSSSRGTAFKNNLVETVLTVSIFYGGQIITNVTDMWAAFGPSAYLEWWWLRLDDAEYGVISSADDRLTQGGFAFAISPDDVDEKTDFRCMLHTTNL